MKWTRRTTLIAGLVLIGLVNALALGGVAYNRSGEPESTLSLTERELWPPHDWAGRKENSGLALHLQWRVPQRDAPNASLLRMAPDAWAVPSWLDESKMASLGFDMRLAPARREVDPMSGYERKLPREVFVVLELDGPAYRAALERAASAAKELETKNERGDGKRVADEMMGRETRRSSRLFAVDAGLDREALRGRYHDRARYAIVRGQVRPTWLKASNEPAGFITELSAAVVNVPLEMRSVFEAVARHGDLTPNGGTRHFEARVAFGQRLEPWLVSAATQ